MDTPRAGWRHPLQWPPGVRAECQCGKGVLVWGDGTSCPGLAGPLLASVTLGAVTAAHAAQEAVCVRLPRGGWPPPAPQTSLSLQTPLQPSALFASDMQRVTRGLVRVRTSSVIYIKNANPKVKYSANSNKLMWQQGLPGAPPALHLCVKPWGAHHTQGVPVSVLHPRPRADSRRGRPGHQCSPSSLQSTSSGFSKGGKTRKQQSRFALSWKTVPLEPGRLSSPCGWTDSARAECHHGCSVWGFSSGPWVKGYISFFCIVKILK